MPGIVTPGIMASQVWLKTFRECGIPAHIDPDAHRSVVAMLEAAMKTHAGSPAFHSFGQTLTYADAFLAIMVCFVVATLMVPLMRKVIMPQTAPADAH